MARINTNIPSLTAQVNLGKANQDLQLRLQRLATGVRINRGADDPAGLIAADRLNAELRGVEQGIKNSERASNVIATTEAALAEVSELLNSIKSLIVEAANAGAFSPEEVAANQLQIDSAIDSITRISNTSSFAGLKLLNGELGYSLSGVVDTEVLKAQINGVSFGTRTSIPVDVEVINSAQQGQLFLRGDFSNAAVFNPPGTDGALISTVTLEIAGPGGVQVLTFLSGQTLSEVVAAVNAVGDSTGVRAEMRDLVDVTSGVRFYTSEYGSDAFVSVQRLGTSGQFFGTARLLDDLPEAVLDFDDALIVTQAKTDEGRDVAAVVNGALATGRGLGMSLKSSELDAELTLSPTFATTVDGSSSTFHVTGGGSLFQLGPRVAVSQQVNIGIQSVAGSRLGGTVVTDAAGVSELQFINSVKSGGVNALALRNFQNASDVLDTAIDEIARLRGRLGAFERNVVDTNVRSLQAAVENITSAESEIRDADFAVETSALTRAQILASSSTSVLAAANVQAQNVLQLLG